MQHRGGGSPRPCNRSYLAAQLVAIFVHFFCSLQLTPPSFSSSCNALSVANVARSLPLSLLLAHSLLCGRVGLLFALIAG